MNIIKNYVLLLITYITVVNSYKFSSLTHNGVYLELYKWKCANSLKKYKNLNYLQRLFPNIFVGLYNMNEKEEIMLKYIFFIYPLTAKEYMVLDIFNNPSNGFNDDIEIFNSLQMYANTNNIKINVDNEVLKLNNEKYYLTNMYNKV
jgi:hypothetical protein